MFDQVIELEDQLLKIHVNEGEGGLSTLLTIYPLVKLSGVLGLEELLEELISRIEDLENGGGSLDSNPEEMDFSDCGNISVIRGTWDEARQLVYC